MFLSILYTRHVAQPCTGGFTSPSAHSYAGICPFGCMYHSLVNNTSCAFANSGSIIAKGIVWKARSHAAYHGYSHLSGIEITSALLRCIHSRLRPCNRCGGGGGCAGSPFNH